MQEKHQKSKSRILPPASCPKRQEPEKDRSQSALDTIFDMDGISDPVGLPIETSDIEHDAYDYTDKKYCKGQPGKWTGYDFIHGKLPYLYLLEL
jgi:hypothetical protein